MGQKSMFDGLWRHYYQTPQTKSLSNSICCWLQVLLNVNTIMPEGGNICYWYNNIRQVRYQLLLMSGVVSGEPMAGVAL